MLLSLILAQCKKMVCGEKSGFGSMTWKKLPTT